MPIVNCIIPVKNGSDTIIRAINSAFNAGCDEVFVYDDNSTDSTADVLVNTAYYRQPILLSNSLAMAKRGVNYARNYLVEKAAGGLMIPLDADDELIDIKPFRDAWEDGTWVYGDYLECDGKYDTYIKGAPAGSLARKNITGVTFLYLFQDWYKAGGYDPDFAYAEDYAFQCALVNAGVRPVYVPKPLYRRHLRPEGNERTVLAGHYWNFYAQMARAKYPSVFANT